MRKVAPCLEHDYNQTCGYRISQVDKPGTCWAFANLKKKNRRRKMQNILLGLCAVLLIGLSGCWGDRDQLSEVEAGSHAEATPAPGSPNCGDCAPHCLPLDGFCGKRECQECISLVKQFTNVECKCQSLGEKKRCGGAESCSGNLNCCVPMGSGDGCVAAFTCCKQDCGIPQVCLQQAQTCPRTPEV